MFKQQCRGFNLIELITVLLILALLLTLALPRYQRQTLVARRTLGSTALSEVVARQQLFFLDHKRYANSLVELGFPESPYAIDSKGRELAAASTERIYRVALTTQDDGYIVYATPQLGQAPDYFCGTLSLSSLGVKAATGEGAAAQCW